MLPELGQILLMCALLASLLQAGLPLLGAHRNNTAWMAVARPAALAQLLLLAGAFAVLTAAFVQQDFSVRYVAENSNSLLPMIYRYSAVWGAHEGSLLMWALVLASFPRHWGRKLLIGSLAMLPIQALNVALQWCNDVFNRAGPEVFVQTGLPGWVADVVAFLYHFNLFIFTALAPVMLWLLLDREFLAKLHAQARAAVAVQRPQ